MRSDVLESPSELDAVDGLLAEFESCCRQSERLLGDLWNQWELAVDEELAAAEAAAGDRSADDPAAVAQAAADCRRELDELQAQLEDNQQRQAALEQQRAELETRRAGLEQERAVMEAELAELRRRADLQSEMLGQQQQLLSQQQQQWHDQLQPMRQMLEQLSDRMHLVEEQHSTTAEPRPDLPPAAEVPADHAPAAAGTMSDPVLDSVMAQFDLLPKDLARRRNPRTESRSR